MQKALLIIDWEKEWIDPSSDYYIGSDLSTETERMNQLISKCRANNTKIIFIKHVEPEGEVFNVDQPSTEFIDGLGIQSEDTIITKNKISSFYKTELDTKLEGVAEVIVAGILTNLCVRSAVHDAYDRDLHVTLVSDCCIAFDQETQDFTLKDLKATRPEIEVVSLEEI